MKKIQQQENKQTNGKITLHGMCACISCLDFSCKRHAAALGHQKPVYESRFQRLYPGSVGQYVLSPKVFGHIYNHGEFVQQVLCLIAKFLY